MLSRFSCSHDFFAVVQRAYLPRTEASLLAALAIGQRTPLFLSGVGKALGQWRLDLIAPRVRYDSLPV